MFALAYVHDDHNKLIEDEKQSGSSVLNDRDLTGFVTEAFEFEMILVLPLMQCFNIQKNYFSIGRVKVSECVCVNKSIEIAFTFY